MHLEQRTRAATRFFFACTFAIAVLVTIGAARASAETLYLACPHQVLKLVDLNGDADAMDIGEVIVFADALPEDITAIGDATGTLYVVDAGGSAILAIRDMNGDGDAMDLGEVSTFADLSPWMNDNAPIGLAIDHAGSLYTLDIAGGLLLKLTDINNDGDTFDSSEIRSVANNLGNGLTISCRDDRSILIAMSDYATPVRLLDDHNGDGDFLDFAENMSYAASFAPGFAIAATDAATALLARNSNPRILKLTDSNGDNDVMDIGEVMPYAELAVTLTAMAHRSSTDAYIAAGSTAGTVYCLHDLNGDGDALDAGEIVVFASGLPVINGMTISATGCLPGDLNGDGTLDMSDVADFVDIVLGLTPPAELCRADLNNDGKIDGGDIAPLVQRMME